jgi:hypothetical protein
VRYWPIRIELVNQSDSSGSPLRKAGKRDRTFTALSVTVRRAEGACKMRGRAPFYRFPSDRVDARRRSGARLVHG